MKIRHRHTGDVLHDTGRGALIGAELSFLNLCAAALAGVSLFGAKLLGVNLRLADLLPLHQPGPGRSPRLRSGGTCPVRDPGAWWPERGVAVYVQRGSGRSS